MVWRAEGSGWALKWHSARKLQANKRWHTMTHLSSASQPPATTPSTPTPQRPTSFFGILWCSMEGVCPFWYLLIAQIAVFSHILRRVVGTHLGDTCGSWCALSSVSLTLPGTLILRHQAPFHLPRLKSLTSCLLSS